MTTKKKFGDNIYIEWIDSATTEGWKSVEEMRKHTRKDICIKSRGFFLWENKDFLAICLSIHDDEVNGTIHIPKGCIIKVK